MRSFDLSIDEKYFNLLWRSLSERENELQFCVDDSDTDPDSAALLGNELVYLRMCKNDLEEKAKQANFSEGAFSIDEDYIDLADL